MRLRNDLFAKCQQQFISEFLNSTLDEADTQIKILIFILIEKYRTDNIVLNKHSTLQLLINDKDKMRSKGNLGIDSRVTHADIGIHAHSASHAHVHVRVHAHSAGIDVHANSAHVSVDTHSHVHIGVHVHTAHVGVHLHVCTAHINVHVNSRTIVAGGCGHLVVQAYWLHVDRGRRSIVNDDGFSGEIGSSPSCSTQATPLLNCFRSTTNATVIEAIVAESITSTYVAAFGVNHAQIFRLAEPPRVDEVCLVATPTTHSTIVVPPTAADKALTHIYN